MVDDRGLPEHYGVQAGRDALVAGRDIHVQYVTYNGTWSDGVAQPPLVISSGSVTAPYRGLSPFREEDGALFFGRERATTEMLALLSGHLYSLGLLVMSGVSGAGKSSLLRARVLPRLRQDGLAAAPSAGSWPCLVLNPSDSPLDELADALSVMLRVPANELRAALAADPLNFTAIARQAALSVPDSQPGVRRAYREDARLLLVVDQCERLFTQCAEGKRRDFMSALYAATAGERNRGRAPAAMAVLAIRADFEARLAEYRPAEFPELGQAVQERFLLRAMSEWELRLAITGPAGKAGFRVDESLVQALLAEMRASPADDGQAIGSGTLPLLSHALDQAWRTRAGHDLELADYEKIGGVQRAVAMTAEQAYGQLSSSQQQAARAIFTRLVATGGDGADTAIRLPVTDLITTQEPGKASDVDVVLEAFASQRLLTMASGTVEISHESLLTAWPLLRDTWLAETRADRIVRTRLRATAAEWDRQSRDPSYLYHGSVLQEAAASMRRIDADPVRNPPLTGQERAFLTASTRGVRRSARRLRAVLAVFAVLAVTTSIFAVVAFYDAGNATRLQAIALSRQLAADSLAAAPVNRVTARQLAVAAWHVYPTTQAETAMLTLIAAQQQGILPVTAKGPVSAVAFSPDGNTLATADSTGIVRLWDFAAGQPSASLRADTSGKYKGVNGVAYSPDGKTLATADANGTVQLWNTATGRPVASLRANTTGTYTDANGTAIRPTGISLTHNSFIGVNGVAYSPDGKTLATADVNGTAQLWNASTGTLIASLTVDTKSAYIGVEAVAFSPDGKTLATAGDDGFVRRWTTRGHPAGKPLFANAQVARLAFSPDGKTLATADTGEQQATSRAQLWDLATGEPIKSFPANPSSSLAVQGVTLSPDGTFLATADGNGTAKLWNTSTGTLVTSIPADTAGGSPGVLDVAFSPDGKILATADADGTARLWSLTSAGAASPFSAHDTFPVNTTSAYTGVDGVAFSPNGKLLATADTDGKARLWNAAGVSSTRKPVASLRADTTGTYTGVAAVAFSPDGTLLATADYDGKAKLWNTPTGTLVTSIHADANSVNGVVFSPDGTLLATAGDNGTAKLWNTPTGTLVTSIRADAQLVNGVAFSPDGTLLATADHDGTAKLWNTSTGKLVTSISAETTGPYPAVNGVAFSPDGTLLATAGENDTVQLWDAANGKPVGNPIPTGGTGQNIGVDGVAFSPDGKLLAIADADGTTQLWTTATGQLIASHPSSAKANGVAFGSAWKVLATAYADGTVKLWATPLSVDDYQALCSGFGPPTQEEWTRYASGEPFPKAC